MLERLGQTVGVKTLAIAGLSIGLSAVWFTLYGRDIEDAQSFLLAHKSDERVDARVLFRQTHKNTALAHYTEHLVWLNANDGDRDADRHSNAWTNSYAVGYWLSGAPEDLPDLLSNLKGVFDPLDLPECFALEERDIVLREYDFRVADNPVAQAAEAMKSFLYHGNSISASVIGTPEDILGFTYDQAKALHAATHRPDNAMLVVTGDVTQRQLNRAMAQAYWPEGVAVKEVLSPPPFDLAPAAIERLEIADIDDAPRLIWRKAVTMPAPVQFDLLDAQTALLADILRANLPGGIAGPLRIDAPIVRSFDIRIWPIDEDTIELEFFAAPDSGVTLTEVEQAFASTLSDIATSGIPDATFTRVLARFEDFWPDWNDDDETAAWMADYVLDRVSTLRVPLSERELKRLNDALSLPTTNTLLQQLTGEGRTAIAYIGQKETN